MLTHRTVCVNAKLAVDYCKRSSGLVRKMLRTSPKFRPHYHAIRRRRGHRKIVYPPQENRLPLTGELKRYHREIGYPPQEKPSWGVLFWSCGSCLSDMGRFAAAHGGAHQRTQADLCAFIHKNPPYNEKK